MRLKGIIAVLVVLALTMSAYGQDKKVIKFAVWGLQEKATQPYFDQLKTEFEKANPDISIQWVSYPYTSIRDQILIMASAGETPDLAQTDRAWVSGFAASGFFAPIDTVLPASYVADVYPSIRSAMTFNGKLWATPWIYSPFILYYNADLFKKAGLDPSKPPRTYEEALAYGVKLSALKDKDGSPVYGLGMTTASVVVSGSYLLSMMYSFGASPWDQAGRPAANNAKTVAALGFVKSAFDKNLNPPVAKLKDLRNLFGIGRLGMYFDQTWGINAAFATNPDAKNWTRAALPLGGAGAAPASTLEAHVFMVGVDSKVKPEVARLIQFITSSKQLDAYQAINPFLVGLQSLNTKPELIDPLMRPLAKAGTLVVAVPSVQRLDDQLLALTNAAQAVTVGKTDPRAAAADLDNKLKSLSQ